jgi:putative Holliday junction resolvase
MRILAIDFGSRVIGLAITDELQLSARPLSTIPSKKDAAARIRALCEEYEVGTVVIGLPLRLDGTHGDAAQRVTEFITKLQEVLTIPIVPQDERLTTRAADEMLRDEGVPWQQRREKLDAYAAAIILEDYLAAERRKTKIREIN